MGERQECDLVMKGGITSGVIYPELVATLADTYRLRCVGGTSAGAMAAGAAAAAELGRQTGRNASAFEALRRITVDLTKSVDGHSRLLSLFQPSDEARRHFAVLVAALNAKSGLRRAAAILLAALEQFPLAALLGALPGVALTIENLDRPIAVSIGVVAIVLGAVIGSLVHLAWALPTALTSENGFGLCSGMSAPGAVPSALTPWLHETFQTLSGLEGKPLTFGDLRRGARPDGASGNEIQLAMITTAIGQGRPFRLPFETANLYFRTKDLNRILPPDVVAWMVAHPRPSETVALLNENVTSPEERFHALPVPDDFPVLLAVRLSLSFPTLISAVPLHAVDFSLAANAEPNGPRRATRVLFTDGGVCSNFPIHFFDAPIPSRPTFGVNLRDFHPDRPDQRILLRTDTKRGSTLEDISVPESGGGARALLGFLGGLVTTMQNWRDQLHAGVPGYRERIVHICHSETEGGLNLDMDKETVDKLAEAGRDAARALVDAYANGGLGWRDHRATRVLIATALIQLQVEGVKRALARPAEPTVEEVLQQALSAEASRGLDLFADISNAAARLETNRPEFLDRAPKPVPELRVTARE